jgi:hypothetical protein
MMNYNVLESIGRFCDVDTLGELACVSTLFRGVFGSQLAYARTVLYESLGDTSSHEELLRYIQRIATILGAADTQWLVKHAQNVFAQCSLWPACHWHSATSPCVVAAIFEHYLLEDFGSAASNAHRYRYWDVSVSINWSERVYNHVMGADCNEPQIRVHFSTDDPYMIGLMRKDGGSVYFGRSMHVRTRNVRQSSTSDSVARAEALITFYGRQHTMVQWLVCAFVGIVSPLFYLRQSA